MAVRDNKFARQTENITKKNLTGEETLTIDAQLVRLEEDIRKLKIEFDIFFNGGAKRAPYDTKNRVETVIKRLADERSLTYAQRYFYNSLVARFTSFRELWRRTMQGREEGRGAAAMRQMQAEKQSDVKRIVCHDVERDQETTRKIYDELIQAKLKCNKSVDELSFPSFQKQLAAQIAKFRQNNDCQKIAFEIGVKENTVIFKARAANDD